MIFVVFVTEDEGKYCAIADTIKTGENLVSHIERYKGCTVCHLCESREEADRLARLWNESYKAHNAKLAVPVGRIEYLGTNGKVGETVEYTDAQQFEETIKHENYYGTPMRVVVYRNADGETIPHGFIANCDPPLQGFVIENHSEERKKT